MFSGWDKYLILAVGVVAVVNWLKLRAERKRWEAWERARRDLGRVM